MSSIPTLTGNEVEFLAEEEVITVVPNFRMDVLTFVNHDYGPFRPNFPIELPLWLAIQLRTAGKCTVVAPAWMDIQFLNSRYQEEQSDEKYFKSMPAHYGEVTNLILNNCGSDIASAAQIRTLVKDIADLRQGKIRQGLKQIQAETNVLKLNKISLGELNEVRQLCLQALLDFNTLSGESNRQDGSQTQASQSSASQPSQTTTAAAPLRTLRTLR